MDDSSATVTEKWNLNDGEHVIEHRDFWPRPVAQYVAVEVCRGALDEMGFERGHPIFQNEELLGTIADGIMQTFEGKTDMTRETALMVAKREMRGDEGDPSLAACDVEESKEGGMVKLTLKGGIE